MKCLTELILRLVIFFSRFRLVSPRSYIITLIRTFNKFHKQTKALIKNLSGLLRLNYENCISY